MKKISVYKELIELDSEGFVSLGLDDESKKDFYAIIRPIDQRRYIDYKTSRLRRRLICFLKRIEAKEGDFLRIENDETLYRINEIRRYERHVELETEALI